jgi:hypothetical protein
MALQFTAELIIKALKLKATIFALKVYYNKFSVSQLPFRIMVAYSAFILTEHMLDYIL